MSTRSITLGKGLSQISVIVAFCGLLSLFPAGARADFEETTDLSASVEILPKFTMTLNNPLLSFPLVNPGESVTLGEGQGYHQLICRSNHGRPWRVAAELRQLKNIRRGNALPAAQLEWSVVGLTSDGFSQGTAGFQKFSPGTIIYTAQGEALKGQEVVLNIAYRLTCPLTAPAGAYAGEVVFTMTEDF